MVNLKTAKMKLGRLKYREVEKFKNEKFEMKLERIE